MISERTENLNNYYICAGNRAYLIGAQDGAFPNLGWHLHGEMGGLWAHPIKLLDGFWLQVNGTWLTEATSYTGGPFWQEHRYEGLRKGLTVTRRQFVPDGEPALVVRYTLTSPVDRQLKLRFLARAQLLGAWLSDDDGIRTGYTHAAFDAGLQAWVCRDDLNPWRVIIGARGAAPEATAAGRALWGPEQTGGRGISVALDYTYDVKAGEELVVEYVIAGTHTGEADARRTYATVRTNAEAMEQAKAGRYAGLLKNSAIDIPDPAIQKAWDWVKCNYDWLVRTVPELGTGLGAGAQDYPWWFGCDNSYALLGCLALGQHATAIQTLDLLRELSIRWNGNTGRVIHEANPWGRAFNPGNAQETPHYICAVWETFRWTGDRDFLRRSYDFCRRGLLDWTLGKLCRDGDLLPYGYGIIEIADLNLQLIDTAVYTAKALDALAAMADLIDDPITAERCRQLAPAIKRRIDEAFWMESESMYGDMLATPAELIPRLKHWLRQADGSGAEGRVKPPEVAFELRRLLHLAESDPEPERKRAWNCRNWVVICPAEAGLAAPERARRMLARVESPEFTGRWGLYLSGLDHTHTMTISTGVAAVAEGAYGRAEEALEYSRKIAETLGAHMPGAISEMSPDYGCFVQAWSGYGIAWPLVAQIFGIRPDAHHRRLELKPAFPAGWAGARLSGVRIGSNRFDFTWDGARLHVTAAEPGWSIIGG